MTIFKKDNLSWQIELVTLITIVVGLTFAAMELRQLRAEQESQTILQLFETITSDEYIRASSLLDRIPDGLTSGELESRLSQEDLDSILQLKLTWEALGVMVFRRDVSIQWINELFRYNILRSWDKLSSLTYAEREDTGYGGINEWHEWLVDRLRSLEEGEQIPAYEAYKDWTP